MSEYNTGIVSGLGGKSHSYSYCVKPPSELRRDMNRQPSIRNSGSFRNMISSGASMASYAGSLATNPTIAISKDCKHILGNKYVLKTNMNCKDETGKIQTRYKYIDNTKCKSILTGGRDLGKDCGYIPSTIASATNLNIGGIFKSFSGKAIPPCKKKKLKYHLVNSRRGTYHNGCTPWVYIAEDDITSDINPGGNNHCEGYSNINVNHVNDVNDVNNKLNDLYYFSLIILIFYIIYKINTKKN